MDNFDRAFAITVGDALGAMAREDARKLWDDLRCQYVPWVLALTLFDAAVAHGAPLAVRWLQTALGEPQDGQMQASLLGAIARGDAEAAAREMLARRAHHMAGMPGFGTLGLGWLRRLMLAVFQAAPG
jgi:lysozyme family protein